MSVFTPTNHKDERPDELLTDNNNNKELLTELLFILHLQVVVTVWLLWTILGPSVLAGLAVMIILIPVNVLIASRQQKLQVSHNSCNSRNILNGQ